MCGQFGFNFCRLPVIETAMDQKLFELLHYIVGSPDEPSDGTVAVSETNLEGLKDRIKMPVGHSGLLLSADVVEQLEQFLIHGSFNHG